MTNPLPADLVAAMNAMDSQIVAGKGSWTWTRAELNGLFSRVQPAENWKARIDAETVFVDDRERAGMIEAVIFFTGSVPTLQPLNGNRYRVRAAGYYATIGA